MFASVFHESWWLDATTSGEWSEVEVREDGRPVARMPFVERRIMSARLVTAPPLCPRLGPMVVAGEGRREARTRRFDHLVDGLIDQLPRADLHRWVLHPAVSSWLPFHRRGFRVEPQISYVVEGLADLDTVWSEIAGPTRRVIRNARKVVAVERDTTAERLGPMVKATFRRQGRRVPYDLAILDRVVREAVRRDRGVVLTAVDAAGAVHASSWCVWDADRAWYLGGGGDPEKRMSGAGSLLMWELIRASVGRATSFDFEGSMLPSVERYVRNFGGRRETCYLVTRTSPRFVPLWSARAAALGAVARRRERAG